MIRPEFCENAHCLQYINGLCQLKEVVNRNWPTKSLRDSEISRLNELATEDAQIVIDICLKYIIDELGGNFKP